MTNVLDRFLRYVKVYTTSDEDSAAAPSSERQWDLAHLLADEMKAMGISDVSISEYGVVYGNIPASPGMESLPAVGFVAHIDTSPDFNGENVNPVIHENYNGEDLRLGDSGFILSKANFPHLPSLKGRTLITTDGTSLLGADDKAGIAEILTAAEQVLNENTAHGKICIAFTPDEEVGRGVEHFDLEKFGAAYAFTLDGGPEGELSVETFNAATAVFEINGFNIHPGESKNRMVNAALLAARIQTMLPVGETPRDTCGREGFFHLTHIEGNVEKTVCALIVRDHDAGIFQGRLRTLEHIRDLLNEAYGPETVRLTLSMQYRNMWEVLKDYPEIQKKAEKAIEAAGVKVDLLPVRGGTDGANLSFRGLPCPNLGTGGYAFHGPYEHITLEGLNFGTRIAKNLMLSAS